MCSHRAQEKIDKYRAGYAAPDVRKAFLPAVVSTSGRIHGDLLRLLYLLADNKTKRHFRDRHEAIDDAKAIRGPEPGAQVLEPLHLTRILGSPPDVSLPSLLSFFVLLYLSVCEALKLRSLPFTHPIYVASLYFQ